MINKSLHNQAMKLSKNEFIAEEIVQKSLIKALEYKAEDIYAYASSCLYHVYLNMMQREARSGADVNRLKMVSYHNTTDSSYDSSIDSEERDASWLMDSNGFSKSRVEDKILATTLLKSIDKLPKKKREAIYQRFFDGGCQGVGHNDGLNPNTRKANYRHGIKQLREWGVLD